MGSSSRKCETLKIHTHKHLQYQLGLPLGSLFKIADNIARYYERYESAKSGKHRIYYNPKPELREVQNRIKQLLERLSLPEYLKGGIKGGSAFTNAQNHLNAKFLLNLDVSNFYPTIKPKRVYQLFIKLECQPDIARLLTRLTTADYHLPTGFITSPLIANLIIHDSFGARLYELAQSHKAKYTQFYDDTTISGGNSISRLLLKAKSIIAQSGFKVHPNKGGFFIGKERPAVTGFRVGKRITIDRKYRRDLRKILSDCIRINPSEFIRSKLLPDGARRFDTVETFRQHLQGRVNYLKHDPIQFKRFKELFDQIDWEN